MENDGWRRIAKAQDGVLSRAQLASFGVRRWTIGDRCRNERWQLWGPSTVVTTTGPVSDRQVAWAGVLTGGPAARLAGLAALTDAGLRGWSRETVDVLLPYGHSTRASVPGVRFRRTRRDLSGLTHPWGGIPRLRAEPAALLWASEQERGQTLEGLLSAVVQQRISTGSGLLRWLDLLAPLPQSSRIRDVLAEISGGAGSAAEINVARMCQGYGLARPDRQVRRRDSGGRLRYTDCEWSLPDGRRLVLEVDGSFHMDAATWEDDIVRQRGLSTPDRIIVRCTARELRDEDEYVAKDLIRLGVPRVVTQNGARKPRIASQPGGLTA